MFIKSKSLAYIRLLSIYQQCPQPDFKEAEYSRVAGVFGYDDHCSLLPFYEKPRGWILLEPFAGRGVRSHDSRGLVPGSLLAHFCMCQRSRGLVFEENFIKFLKCFFYSYFLFQSKIQVLFCFLIFYNFVLFVLQGAVNWVLSWRGFLPLSRLSYVVYLIHPVIMVLFIYNKKVLINMNTLEMVSQIFAYK